MLAGEKSTQKRTQIIDTAKYAFSLVDICDILDGVGLFLEIVSYPCAFLKALFNSSLCLQKMAIERSQAYIPLADHGVG